MAMYILGIILMKDLMVSLFWHFDSSPQKDNFSLSNEHICFLGFGKMDYADIGSGAFSYTGEFINGFCHGEGRCFFHKFGEEYEGDFVCDEPVGLKLFQHHGPILEEAECDGGEIADEITFPSPIAPETDETQRRRCSTGSAKSNSSQVSLLSLESAYSAISHEKRQDSKKASPKNQTSPKEFLSLIDRTTVSSKLYRYQNGDTFKGRLDNNQMRQGGGMYRSHKTGSVFVGEWKDNMRHGFGVLTFASGLEYSGEFFNDSIHGQGIITLIDASVYTGSFVDGLFHGYGTLEDASNNIVYTGEFSMGCETG
jgi:hypothetical protein